MKGAASYAYSQEHWVGHTGIRASCWVISTGPALLMVTIMLRETLQKLNTPFASYVPHIGGTYPTFSASTQYEQALAKQPQMTEMAPSFLLRRLLLSAEPQPANLLPVTCFRCSLRCGSMLPGLSPHLSPGTPADCNTGQPAIQALERPATGLRQSILTDTAPGAWEHVVK